jgi:hypothetical protein
VESRLARLQNASGHARASSGDTKDSKIIRAIWGFDVMSRTVRDEMEAPAGVNSTTAAATSTTMRLLCQLKRGNTRRPTDEEQAGLIVLQAFPSCARVCPSLRCYFWRLAATKLLCSVTKMLIAGMRYQPSTADKPQISL